MPNGQPRTDEELRAQLKAALSESEPKSAAVLSSPLATFNGDWVIAPNSPSIEAAGSPSIAEEKFTIRAVLNGRFMDHEYSAKIEGEQYSGRGTLGFDESKQVFIEEFRDSLGNVNRVEVSDYNVSPTAITLRYSIRVGENNQSFISEYRVLTNASWEYRLTDSSGAVIKRVTFRRA